MLWIFLPDLNILTAPEKCSTLSDHIIKLLVTLPTFPIAFPGEGCDVLREPDLEQP